MGRWYGGTLKSAPVCCTPAIVWGISWGRVSRIIFSRSKFITTLRVSALFPVYNCLSAPPRCCPTTPSALRTLAAGAAGGAQSVVHLAISQKPPSSLPSPPSPTPSCIFCDFLIISFAHAPFPFPLRAEARRLAGKANEPRKPFECKLCDASFHRFVFVSEDERVEKE